MNPEIKKQVQKHYPWVVEDAADDDEIWLALAECFEDFLIEAGIASDYECWQDAMDDNNFTIASCEIPSDYWFDFESAFENARDNYEPEEDEEEEDYEALDYEEEFE